MTKIVIDATALSPNPSGIGLYIYNLIYALYSLQRQENFELGIAYQPRLKQWLLGKVNYDKNLNLDSQVYILPIPVTISSILSKFPNPILPYYEPCLGLPDIFHGTDNVVYPCTKSFKVMTIYDLTCIKYPNFVNSIVRTYKDRIKQSLKWTNLVITISESSKRDIIEYMNIDPSRISVTPLASRYSSKLLSAKVTDQLQSSINYNFSQPYILFVSTIEPRKNIATLISAFNYLKQTHKIDHQLILIGQKGWHYQPIFAAIENSPYKHHIHHLDYLPDEIVALFYSKADVFVYPSHYEGFGLPVLEAMTLGTPVVTSNTSSLPEVAGDAALLINPNNSNQLAEAILNIISDSQLRNQLIEKGKERAKLFSWERTAQETIKAYKSLLT